MNKGAGRVRIGFFKGRVWGCTQFVVLAAFQVCTQVRFSGDASICSSAVPRQIMNPVLRAHPVQVKEARL